MDEIIGRAIEQRARKRGEGRDDGREHKNRGRIKGNRRRKDWDPSSWFIEQRARKEGRGGMLLGREVLKKGGIGMTSPTRDAEEGR